MIKNQCTFDKVSELLKYHPNKNKYFEFLKKNPTNANYLKCHKENLESIKVALVAVGGLFDFYLGELHQGANVALEGLRRVLERTEEYLFDLPVRDDEVTLLLLECWQIHHQHTNPDYEWEAEDA